MDSLNVNLMSMWEGCWIEWEVTMWGRVLFKVQEISCWSAAGEV